MTQLTTRTIPLTKGYVALVDAADFEMLSHWSWSANLSHGAVYAATKVMSNGLRRELSMHRMVALPDPEQLVDHRNGDSLDNRRDNLRSCTNTQNQRNRRAIPGGTSRFKGVSWHERGQKWSARIGVDGRWRYLGLFRDERDAALAYNATALAEFGEFARVNDIGTLP